MVIPEGWSEKTVFYIAPWCRGIGDHLQYSRLPEFYWKQFGKPFKLLRIDKLTSFEPVDKYKIWEKLPHVEFIDDPAPDDFIINLWFVKQKTFGNPVFQNIKKFYDGEVDPNIKPTMGYIPKVDLVKNRVGFCTEGADRYMKNWARVLPAYLIDMLIRQFPNLEFVQFGGKENFSPKGIFTDYTGLSVQESFRKLASCSVFIGVNSGFMHLANCISWIKPFIYVESPVVFPHTAEFLSEFETNNWLYEDNVFFSANPKSERVISISGLVENLKWLSL